MARATASEAKHGEVTVGLPFPAPPDTIAIYRAFPGEPRFADLDVALARYADEGKRVVIVRADGSEELVHKGRYGEGRLVGRRGLL